MDVCNRHRRCQLTCSVERRNFEFFAASHPLPPPSRPVLLFLCTQEAEKGEENGGKQGENDSLRSPGNNNRQRTRESQPASLRLSSPGNPEKPVLCRGPSSPSSGRSNRRGGRRKGQRDERLSKQQYIYSYDSNGVHPAIIAVWLSAIAVSRSCSIDYPSRLLVANTRDNWR